MHIPSLDLQQFTQGNTQEKKEFVQALGSAFHEIGFVSIKNHGLSESLIASLYEQVELFFSLPDEQKKNYEIPGIGGQRGYTSFGKEHAKGSNTGDLKEFWHFGNSVNEEQSLALGYPKNVACLELPLFNEVGQAAYSQLESCGEQLLRSIALYLNLDEHYFDARIKDGNSILRPIHYPPIQTAPDGAVRAGAHEDINLITLLIGASAEGLQILSKQQEWVAITALPDHIVVNVGDMLQRLTNNKLKSTTHRVVNPPEEKWHLSRYSIPFFLHPRSEMRLDCLTNCVSAENPKLYSDCSAGDYLNERLREIGLIK